MYQRALARTHGHRRDLARACATHAARHTPSAGEEKEEEEEEKVEEEEEAEQARIEFDIPVSSARMVGASESLVSACY